MNIQKALRDNQLYTFTVNYSKKKSLLEKHHKEVLTKIKNSNTTDEEKNVNTQNEENDFSQKLTAINNEFDSNKKIVADKETSDLELLKNKYNEKFDERMQEFDRVFNSYGKDHPKHESSRSGGKRRLFSFRNSYSRNMEEESLLKDTSSGFEPDALVLISDQNAINSAAHLVQKIVGIEYLNSHREQQPFNASLHFP